MSEMDWLPTLLSWSALLLLGALFFVGRHWLTAKIDSKVASRTQREIEAYRADLNAEREQIAALRDSVLSGRANRQALLDRRRIEAVSNVWRAVNELARFKPLAVMIQGLDIKVAGERAPSDQKVQEFAADLLKTIGEPKALSSPAAADEPFVPAEVWALYRAYEGIATMAYAVLSTLARGLDPIGLLKFEEMADMMKATLPHQSQFVDDVGPSAAFFLMNEVRAKLLAELREMLEGDQFDRRQLEQAQQIARQATTVSEGEARYRLALDAPIPDSIKAKPRS